MGDLNDVGPDALVWSPNVDYLTGWLQARQSADR